MSGGVPCNCEQRKKPIDQRDWLVTAYRNNTSAFNGYRRTSSDYSEVRCMQCRGIWRTKAAYVERLKRR